MIRCVVFDDEPLILRSIVRKIQHLNPEYKVVATAANGQEGCRVIKEYRPDVVFTDIYMPVMNGLDIIAYVREEMISARCVILSGYRDFEYAKRAIKYGVKDYLLKPIDNQKLKNLLDALSEEIRQKRQQEKRKLLECIKYKILAPLAITEAYDKFFDAGKLHLFECKLCIGSYFTETIKSCKNNCCTGKGLDYETASRKLCEENGCDFFIFYGPHQNEVSIYFLSGAESNFKTISGQLYQSLKRQLREDLHLTFAVSRAVTSLEEVDRLERETANILFHEQVFALSSLIFSGDERHSPFGIPEEKFIMLKKAAGKGEDEKAWEIVSEILNFCEEKRYSRFMLRNTVRRIFQCFPAIPEDRAGYFTDLAVNSCDNYTELFTTIEEWIHRGACIEDSSISGQGPEDIIGKIEDYIVKHYRDPIRVQDIAQKFGFNYSYLCTVFRKYKGVSPNEYIIEKRVQEAKFLLKAYPEMTVKEIADKVGYKDSLYFSRIFKKITCYSPADYRHFAAKEEK